MAMTLALRGAAEKMFAKPEDASKRHKYFFSVTEEEIHRGILNIPKEERANNCLWFKRNIVDLDTHIKKKDSRVGAFTDLIWGKGEADEDARALLAQVRERLLPRALEEAGCVVKEYDVAFAPEAGIDLGNKE